ncbi:subtilisin-like protein [Myriangium duriaei CBS 260.36]|uniref:Subtilisin-like protein n=1 Tax=Myriangium duriaei CBS 260.36 TaxID=1168546 RepID=A0A9P4MFN0_9PEZI|nr:subtilisin-like protein [Myriangium duriaei CBS 260.36]
MLDPATGIQSYSKSAVKSDLVYIITLRRGANLDQHLASVRSIATKFDPASKQHVEYSWDLPSFHAYAGTFEKDVLDKLRNRDDVASVEESHILGPDPDEMCGSECEGYIGTKQTYTNQQNEDENTPDQLPPDLIVQKNAPYYLRQISHRDPANSREGYAYNKSMTVTPRIYIVDSGIDSQQHDFSCRVVKGYNAAKGKFKDQLRHGTAVAAVVGGTTYGVLKNCTLIDVRVLAQNSTSTMLLDGVVWAIKDVLKNPSGRKDSVINMSLGYEIYILESFAMNSLVRAAYALDVSVVVAAANVNSTTTWNDKAIVVGYTDKNFTRSRFSNYGPAVSIFAPGVGIVPKTARGIDWRRKMSGSSFAAPQVAMMLAYLKMLYGISSARKSMDMLYKLATPGIVKDTRGSRNRFLYNGSGR